LNHRLLYPSPNQQRQSSEGNKYKEAVASLSKHTVSMRRDRYNKMKTIN